MADTGHPSRTTLHIPPLVFRGTAVEELANPAKLDPLGPGPFQFLCAHGHDPEALQELLNAAYVKGYEAGMTRGAAVGRQIGVEIAGQKLAILGDNERYKAGFEEGRAYGFADGVWKGYDHYEDHARIGLAPPGRVSGVDSRSTVSTATQTALTPSPTHPPTPIQTGPPTALLAHVAAPAPAPPPPPPPRDLTALRSDQQPIIRPPFGSLKRRARRRFQAHRPSPSSRHPHPVTALDWDRDPRLSDLARALTGLGWVRAR